MKNLIALFVALLPTLALAAEEGHGAATNGAGGIPEAVIYQFIHFAIFVGLLVFFLRKPVRAFFSNREQAFRQALVKAEAARKEAEAKQREIQERLTRLQNNSQESIAQAKAEAEALKAKIIQDAAEMSQRLRDEARRTAELEIERAKNELREEMLTQSIELAKKMLNDKIAEPDQKRLQTEFVDKIQVVR